MSHEIRTPLNGVLGMSQLLRTSSLDPDQKQCVQVMAASAETLQELVGRVLDSPSWRLAA